MLQSTTSSTTSSTAPQTPSSPQPSLPWSVYNPAELSTEDSLLIWFSLSFSSLAWGRTAPQLPTAAAAPSRDSAIRNVQQAGGEACHLQEVQPAAASQDPEPFGSVSLSFIFIFIVCSSIEPRSSIVWLLPVTSVLASWSDSVK